MRRSLLGILLSGVIWLNACSIPAWVNTVEADAKVAAPIAASLIDVIDPSLAPLVSAIEGGFTALANTLDTFKSEPTATNLQAVQAAFQAVDANVAQLESAAQIKNAATQDTVTQVVGLLAQAVTEMGALVPAQAQAASPAVAHSHSASGGLRAKGLKASDLKKQFNNIVKNDPRFKPLK